MTDGRKLPRSDRDDRSQATRWAKHFGLATATLVAALLLSPGSSLEDSVSLLSIPSAMADPGDDIQIHRVAVNMKPRQESTGNFLSTLGKVFGRSPKSRQSFEHASIDPNLKNIGVVALATYAHGTTPSLGRRNLAVRDDVYKDERVETGIDGSLHVKFADQTDFFLGPETSMVLENFVFESTEKGSLIVRLESDPISLDTELA